MYAMHLYRSRAQYLKLIPAIILAIVALVIAQSHHHHDLTIKTNTQCDYFCHKLSADEAAKVIEDADKQTTLYSLTTLKQFYLRYELYTYELRGPPV